MTFSRSRWCALSCIRYLLTETFMVKYISKHWLFSNKENLSQFLQGSFSNNWNEFLMINNFLLSIKRTFDIKHGLGTPRVEISFTARPKIQSQSQIFKYGGSIFCLPHRPNFSDIFDLCLHWVSVVRDCSIV